MPTPIVLGVTVDGRFVTLVDVRLTNRQVSIPGGIRTEAIVRTAFAGMHASTEQALRLHSLRARASHLTEWLGRTAIDLSQAVFPKAGTATWHTPSTFHLARVRRTLVSAEFEMVGERDGRDRNHRISLEQRSSIVVRPSTRSRSFDELRDLLEDVRRYLAFATGVEVEFLELRGDATITGTTFGTGRRWRQREPVWVLYRQRVPSEGASHPARHMLFRHSDSAFANNRPLTRWCRRAATLKPIYDLYLTAQPRRGVYLEFRFLALAQALEALHARLHPGTQASLRQRLDALIQDLPHGVRQHVPPRFLAAMVDTRNYLTHWDRKKEAKALQGDDLFALTEGAKLLLELTMMTTLGFPKRRVEQLVLSNQRLVRNIQLSFQSL